MVGRRIEYNGVPTSDLENNTNQKKYTINKSSGGYITISKPTCALFVMGACLLAAVAAVATYFAMPACSEGGAAPGPSSHQNTQRFRDRGGGVAIPIPYNRLPGDVMPVHYRLFIAPELHGNFTTRGNVTIDLKVTDKADKIVLNALDLDIDEHSLVVRHRNYGVRLKSQWYNQEAQEYVIELDTPLSPGDGYQLFMEFRGTLNDFMVGFYRSHYVPRENETRWLASTQFSPTDARRAFPCFDEPAIKAKFTISVARSPEMTTLSNMPLKDSTVIKDDDLIWDNYESTPVMSTYLVAFIAHDFSPYQHDFNTNFTVWTARHLLDHATYSAMIGPQILQYFEQYFNIKFALPKIDVVALPDFGFSAMENWGLITFREKMLLLDRLASTVVNERDIALTLGHEIAHSWFGNLVTPKWWDDLWLKEGFATYFEYLSTNKIHPDWKILEEFYFYETNTAFKTDRLTSSRPIHFNVSNSNDIRQVFDSISYSKGASLVNMMANIMGDQSFQNGMRELLSEHAYSNIDHYDLFEALTAQAHKDGVLPRRMNMTAIMRGWIEQPGFPVVTAIADYQQNKLQLSQKRFLLNGNISESNEQWQIPISYTTDQEMKFNSGKPKFWLKEGETKQVDLNITNWYLLNLKQGYYIVNYDEKNWKILSEVIMQLPPVIRAQLVGDSMNLAKAGLIDYSIPLNMIRIIGTRDKEIIFVPLLSIFEETDFLFDILHNTPVFGIYEKYFWYIFYFALDNVDFREYPTDKYITKRIRRLVLNQSCRQANFKCSLNARQIFRTWMDHNHTVSPNIRDVVYCTAIRDGGEPEWNFAYDQYLRSRSASEKVTLLTALGCSSKSWMLAKYLDMMLSNSSGIRKQDGAAIFQSVANNIFGYNLAFDFLRDKWDEINEYYGEGFRTVSRMVESLATYMNTPQQLKQLISFRNENIYNTTRQAFANTIEKVKTNVQWMKLNYKSVEGWLKQQVEYYRL